MDNYWWKLTLIKSRLRRYNKYIYIAHIQNQIIKNQNNQNNNNNNNNKMQMVAKEILSLICIYIILI